MSGIAECPNWPACGHAQTSDCDADMSGDRPADVERVMALPTRGLHALKYAVQMLREFGSYIDEEGDATNALEELLESLAASSPVTQPPEAEKVCHETYAAIGSILFDLAERGHPQAEKLLDNLSEARLVHTDVLPFADVPGVDTCPDWQQLADMTTRKDAAYEERNKVVAALARLFPSGIARTAIEGWSDDWHGCVYIDLPTGQVSWHFHDSQAHLFAGLPPYTGQWDGHDTPEKYRRVAALANHSGVPGTHETKEDDRG